MSDAQTLTAPAAAPQGLRRTPYRRLLKIASHHKIGAAAFGGVIIVCLLALTAPIIAPYDPFEQDYNSLLQAPSWAHPFGTDRVGRDILTRVLYGTQVSVLVGDAKECETALNEAAGYLRNGLFKRLSIHTVPTLHFLFDRTTERAAELNALIQEANATRAKED